MIQPDLPMNVQAGLDEKFNAHLGMHDADPQDLRLRVIDMLTPNSETMVNPDPDLAYFNLVSTYWLDQPDAAREVAYKLLQLKYFSTEFVGGLVLLESQKPPEHLDNDAVHQATEFMDRPDYSWLTLARVADNSSGYDRRVRFRLGSNLGEDGTPKRGKRPFGGIAAQLMVNRIETGMFRPDKGFKPVYEEHESQFLTVFTGRVSLSDVEADYEGTRRFTEPLEVRWGHELVREYLIKLVALSSDEVNARVKAHNLYSKLNNVKLAAGLDGILSPEAQEAQAV